ncbi:uncharacterized protein LOC129950929 [Eupeodes corollae]|uniref:uncharacterized protein LOC129950929 n=1 Tax=Eupeodes corollae TaxID=290404 RepID=UPI002492DE8C|nr:uncharacterized protein LOC129950929 [Eupeodes corollae]
MVYTERTDKYLSNGSPAEVKTKSPSSSFKTSSAPADSSFRSSGNCSSSSSHKMEDSKWKYNRMVKEDRDKFNNLHHC